MRLPLALALLLASPAAAFAFVGPRQPEPPPRWYDAPMHGRAGGVQAGGSAELRFHYDRVFGVADPNWLTFVRASAFAAAPVSRRLTLLGAAAYDRTTRELEVERLGIDWRVGRAHAQAGVLLLPLLQSNLDASGSQEEFTDRSLVATELVGAPIGQWDPLESTCRHASLSIL